MNACAGGAKDGLEDSVGESSLPLLRPVGVEAVGVGKRVGMRETAAGDGPLLLPAISPVEYFGRGIRVLIPPSPGLDDCSGVAAVVTPTGVVGTTVAAMLLSLLF